MPATTPTNKLPYPIGTDLLADGDNAIQALATALDGTPWAAVSLFANGWTNYGGGYQPARYRKQNGELWLQGVVKPGGIGTNAFTLPAGFTVPTTNLVACGAATAVGAYYFTDPTGIINIGWTGTAPAWVSLESRVSLLA